MERELSIVVVDGLEISSFDLHIILSRIGNYRKSKKDKLRKHIFIGRKRRSSDIYRNSYDWSEL